jgi:hypothetical protein
MQDDTKVALARLEERVTGVVTLLNEREKALGFAFAASEKAVDKAEGSQLRVNLAQNEFRAALSDQAKQFITRAEHDQLDKRVQALERSFTGGEGRIGAFSTAKTDLFTILLIIIAFAGIVLHFWPGPK